LKFKKALFAGALEGGEKEVFLGGSRLNRFMETVEKATGAIPAAAAQDPPAGEAEDEREEAGAGDAEKVGAGSAAGSVAAGEGKEDFWAGLLHTGLSVLEQLAGASGAGPRGNGGGGAPGLTFVRRDEKSGESYLRFPVPSAEVVDRALGAIGALLERFRK
jgi:hypothetical protein